ncbi:MAG: transporter substrate-binding domain-containing protein [Alphaproteobacteria bacterium]|jgi:polar amino acid transport system substrate-binding protein|nr:transporter substrate-binding domain-containing protein [Alphaproteobacteria bacterium]MBU0803601.1 transporter substrate-binding domain-containing protein [Alphaproteobacteria bacterium]MBU0873102.1 transporter substrate-binding domain-containing protein [Alphaproteobacteria bacterium]MBU1402528.1 transporter substrate-binding domain-containing protein [Alphaproteobacteria bacterium]MBU1593170.1 transporter substrate-binding domain-containing protein [Alphaproteobacteria bacterium]
MRFRSIVLLMTALAFGTTAAQAAEPLAPMFWDSKERLPRPDLSGLKRLRFLTTTDFPPFNFLDGAGRLSGFHIDLAREICTELDISEKCEVQVMPWAGLEQALISGRGEAIIAGIAVTEESRSKYAFSRPYLQFPARFAMLKTKALSEPIYDKVQGERIGVLAGSGHEQMLRDYFPGVQVVTYTRQDWLQADLKAGKIAGTFGDGMRLAFWLAGSDAGGCCRFVGGPYLAPEYLGTGLAIATEIDDPLLTAAFDYALQQIAVKGRFAELYLRYFPVSFY